MLVAPIPDNETERLAELRALQVLDTPHEERFETIVRLAQQFFSVPIVYIALIDEDRQWFKAKCGLTVDQTGREVSFCGHAILENRLMIVTDARHDPRFADNPLVTGDPYVRFYAGHPLAGPHGHNIGTLCLVDRQPRDLDDRQQAILAQLARMAEVQLQLVDLVATQRELLDTKTQLLATQRRLEGELREAEDYVRSLLPPPMLDGAVRSDWTYISSSQLGGDLFGYHWLDDDRLAMYLLDVCGHGVGASLLASSVHSALRRTSLPNCDFSDPGQVIPALDRAFPMSAHHDKFFTIWYGVYSATRRELRSSAAGHHAAMLLPPGGGHVARIGSRGLMVGIVDNRTADVETTSIEPGSRLYLFSDGAFELRQAEGRMLGLDGLAMILGEVASVPSRRTSEIHDRLTKWMGGEPFADDFSMVEFEFT